MQNSEEYQSAKKRVEATIGVYTHLSVCAAVIFLLATVNFMTAAGAICFPWLMMGWGIAVAIHAAVVFVFPSRLEINEQMIEKIMGKSQTQS